MQKETVDGSTLWSDVYTDDAGRDWSVLQREGGSVSLFTTAYGCHTVVWDSLDGNPPNLTTQRILTALEMQVEGANVLLEAARKGAE